MKNKVPTEGTKVRAIYDALMSNKGQPVNLKEFSTKNLNSAIGQLRDIYLMDIVKIDMYHYKVIGLQEPKGLKYISFIKAP